MVFTSIPKPSTSYTGIGKPVTSYSSISEILDDILDEVGGAILDESSGKLKSEQRVSAFTQIPRPT